MQKIIFLNLWLLGLIIISCKKEPVNNSFPNTGQNPLPPTPPPPPPPPTSPVYMNTVPKAFAGSSKFIALPADSCYLMGGSSGDNINIYSWKKITGPSSYFIENAQSISTKVYRLEKGIYEFELTVINEAGYSDKDTVTVSVYEVISSTNEVILKSLEWYCPMGCSLEIQNFHSIVPVGTFFKVFIKRDDSPDWVEVIHTDQSQSTDRYMCGVYKNKLWIYSGTEDEDTPDVKIIF